MKFLLVTGVVEFQGQTRRKRIMLAEKRRDTMLSLEGVALDGMRAYMYK